MSAPKPAASRQAPRGGEETWERPGVSSAAWFWPGWTRWWRGATRPCH